MVRFLYLLTDNPFVKNSKLGLLSISILLAPLFSGCMIDNTITGLKPDNPKPTAAEIRTAGTEFTSMANKNVITNGGYKVSSSVGDKVSANSKTTNSGNYRVLFSVQGELSSLR